MTSGKVVAVLLALCVAGGVVYLMQKPRQPGTAPAAAETQPSASFVGSQDCRSCHERFYELWSTSHHGLAMQPFTPAFAENSLPVKRGQVQAKQATYAVDVAAGKVSEKTPQGEKSFPIIYAMGGKNVFYFLTRLDRGRLQTLPLAYDVNRREWFDTSASAMRHFAEGESVYHWTDPAYTFNTSCHSCHVSQLSKNYSLSSDAYHTTWAEPGINCETCHGPGGEHVRAARELKEGEQLKDVKLIVTTTFTPEQHNATCAPCHAKMSAITATFRPGDRYFDHFDLATLEDADFHPDGRDLGENYTYTLWRMNPCANSGQMHCVQCHTSSGRYRFKTQNPNGACLPCHKDKVDDPPAHTFHKADSEGSRCISCHMPMTEFARMRRSDHSLRPPAPSATIAFKSPNACNICHADQDAAWADAYVRQWRKRDYQAPILRRGALLAAARQRDWARLPEMLGEITSVDRDEVYATSLIRLLASCPDERKWTAIRAAMKDASPLVRSAAAVALRENLHVAESRQLLLDATEDEYRLVRIRAAGALGAFPRPMLGEKDRKRLDAAEAELVAALQARPDDWSSHYNLGSFYSDRGDLAQALRHYELAGKFRPGAVPPLVNASIVYAQVGQAGKAEESLLKALAISPANPAAHFNMGLLKAELGDAGKAEEHLRAALKFEPTMAEAAYNLGVLLAQGKPKESLEWCARAWQLRPGEARYGYTLAFYLDRAGNPQGASEILRTLIDRQPEYVDAYLLLGAIHERLGQAEQAKTVYQRAARIEGLSPRQRQAIEQRLRR